MGKKRNNPYAVEAINQAGLSLYGEEFDLVTPTDLYVKFMPSQDEHIYLLDDWEDKELIPLFSFPLEYTIETDGDYYVDPEVSEAKYTYQYATIPVDVSLPQVPYEIIDELWF